MVYRGQKYRKVGEEGVWEVIEPHRALGHEGEWILGKVGSNEAIPVHERDLEYRNLWIPIRDD